MRSDHSIVHFRVAAFTLAELLVSTAVLGVLTVMLASVVSSTTSSWLTIRSKTDQFASARDAFEVMTRRVQHAALNTYLETKLPAPGEPPQTKPRYERRSELRFTSGPMTRFERDPAIKALPEGVLSRPSHAVFFAAPFGQNSDAANRLLTSTVNCFGYFIEVAAEDNALPDFLKESQPKRLQYRLLELRQPSENFSIYNLANPKAGQSPTDFSFLSESMRSPVENRPIRTVARNIVALILQPRLPKVEEDARVREGLTPWLVVPPDLSRDPKFGYAYDSEGKSSDAEINSYRQLPPVMQVTMVAIDSRSAKLLADRYDRDKRPPLSYEKLFEDVRKFDADLKEFETQLTNLKAAYRTYSTNVVMRGAKWSRNQVN
jgi:uncharacterized protein (TIGR02599 family)